jgi:hypothetical protein
MVALGVDGKIDLKKERSEDTEWIYLAQYRDQFRALVSTAMNLQVP